ncbi:type II secretion system F family protein [Georgenia sp. M64]|uniref:type II secretion system F family protein n=1 Tax=Georgenia sp. M64 TaxID=3120520 RepID=UPI0030E57034
MTLPAVFAILTLSVGLGLLTWTALAGPDRTRARAVANLHRGYEAPHTDNADVDQGSLLQTLAKRLTPAPLYRLLDKLHARAGRPAAWPVELLLVVKVALPVIAGWAMLTLIAATEPSPLFVFVAVATVVVTYFLPELLLYSRGVERREQITLELADTLDQMTIAVEAGLGFDSAMARAGQNGSGPLAEELIRTLQDIQMGQSRRQAFEALGKRTDVVDLRRFIRAVIQADSYGIAVADVLRTQAAEMRMKRRQRAEEKAMQVPVKVIFPLLLCILPVLFIVLLGPAAMDIMAAFS